MQILLATGKKYIFKHTSHTTAPLTKFLYRIRGQALQEKTQSEERSAENGTWPDIFLTSSKTGREFFVMYTFIWTPRHPSDISSSISVELLHIAFTLFYVAKEICALAVKCLICFRSSCLINLVSSLIICSIKKKCPKGRKFCFYYCLFCQLLF